MTAVAVAVEARPRRTQAAKEHQRSRTQAAKEHQPRRTQAARSEAMRRRILDAAVGLLGEKGYAGLRTAEVATAARVSRGALTHHFPTKDGLVIAVVEDVFERASTLGRRRARGRHDRDSVIAALLDDSREFFFSELFLIALDLTIQGRRRPEAAGQKVPAISAASRLPLEAAWIDALVAAGVPRAHADDLLWLTISIVRGLAIRRLWQHDPKRFKHLFDVWRRMVDVYLSTKGRS